MKSNVLKIILFIFFLAVTLFGPVRETVTNSTTFFSRYYDEGKYQAYKQQYYNSQYVKKKNPGIMVDNSLESFAAGIFLRGLNPILIVHDQPPLGRYMISLSLVLFENPNTIMLVFLFSSLVGIYLISFEATKNVLLSFIPPMIFANEPLFLSKFSYTPLLEPIQLPFIVFSIYFFIKGEQSKKYLIWFVATSIMLGFVISTRFFALGAVLLFSLCVVLPFTKQWKKKTVAFFLTLPFSLLVLLSAYTVTIMSGYTPLQIFGIQKYILVYHKSQLTMPFTFLDLILFNKWHTWWAGNAILNDYQWIIVWPVAFVLSIVYFVFALIKRNMPTTADKTMLSWVICYSLFLCLGKTSTRYFLPLVPFLYIASTSFLQKVYLMYYKKR